jgi:hypothetical protein
LATPKPSPITEQQIEKIVEDYLLHSLPLMQKTFNIPQQEENVKRCLFGQEEFLIISKCRLHELPLKILRRLPIYLIRQFSVQVEFDSVWYWALTHDIVRYCNDVVSLRKWQLMESFETMMAAHFAQLYVSSRGVPAFERLNRATADIVSEPVNNLVSNTETILMYVCYPVLEGLSKFALPPLVDCDGKPMADFTVGTKMIKKGGKQISSLAIILRSLEENCATALSKPEFSVNLRDFRLELEKIPLLKPQKNQDGWDSVYGLRNASLHGVTGWQLRSGLITNLICLILWNILDDQTLNKELERFTKMPLRYLQHFGSYYPPEF